MSAGDGSTAHLDDGSEAEAVTAVPAAAAAAAEAAAVPSEESSSLSPASRVLAMADKVADDEDGSVATSDDDGSDDSIGPVSRPSRTMNPGDMGEGGSRQRRRGFVQERRGKHKQSSIRRPLVGSPLESPSGSRASSNDSWRQALFGDRKLSPKSEADEDDNGRDSVGAGSASVAFSEGGPLGGSAEIAEKEQACHDLEEKAVEGMDVKHLKAKAVQLGIPTGGRKSQLKARIKQKLSVSCRLSDGVGKPAAPSSIPADDNDGGEPAATVPGKTTTAATAAVSEDATAVYVTPPSKAASVVDYPPTEETVLAADGSGLGYPEESIPCGRVSADAFASPLAASLREAVSSASDDEYQDATGPCENTPPVTEPKTRELSRSTELGVPDTLEAPCRAGVTAGEDSIPADEKSEGSMTFPPIPLPQQTPGEATPNTVRSCETSPAATGSAQPSASSLEKPALAAAAVAAATAAAIFSVEVTEGDDGETTRPPASGGDAGVAAAEDGCRDAEERDTQIADEEGGISAKGAGADGGTVAGGDSGNEEAQVPFDRGDRERAPATQEGEWSDPLGQEGEPNQQQQQEEKEVFGENESDAAAAALSSTPPVSPPAASAASPLEDGSEVEPSTPGTGVQAAATQEADGEDDADGGMVAATAETPEASTTPIGSVLPVPTSTIGDGLSSVAVEHPSEVHFSALESDDDNPGGLSSPERNNREGGEDTGDREQPPRLEDTSYSEDERSARRRSAETARHVVSASRSGEVVPVVLFSGATEAAAAKEEENDSSDKARIIPGAEKKVEQDEKSLPVAVPSAEALTQKLLEVTLLWSPILQDLTNPGGGGSGCSWSDADPTNTKKTSCPLLPETEALKAKAKVLAAWFHRDARPVAVDIVAEMTQLAAHDSDKVQKSTPPAGHKTSSQASGGAVTAVGGSRVPRRADADGVGGVISSSSTRMSQDRAAASSAAPRARSVAPPASTRASESGDGTIQRIPRAGKGRRGSSRRLSVSPPRTKLTGAAAASRLSSGSRINRRSVAPAAPRSTGVKEPSSFRGGAAAPAGAPPLVRKRNPLIRDLSPPRKKSVSRLSTGRGIGGRDAVDVQGVARRQASAARSRRGGSVDRRTTLEGRRLKGEAVGEVQTPARTRELRYRKDSLAAGHRGNKARTGGNNTRGDSGTAATGRDLDPCNGGGTPTGVTTPGSGGQSALQVFGFDPTVSKPPRDDMATRVRRTPEAKVRAT